MKKNIKELYKYLSGHADIEIMLDEPMRNHTSFKVGGSAELFCELKTNNAVVKALEKAKELGIKPFIIGNGTNFIVEDEGIPGVVFRIATQEWYAGGNRISVDAGVSLSKTAALAKRMSLTGMEFANGIPGTVGGAVYMNAGAYDGEMSNVVKEVNYINKDGYVCNLSNVDLEFGYRTSYFKKYNDCVILNVIFELKPSNEQDIDEKDEDFITRRAERQPLDFPSAGSIFKRPEGHYVGTLIEQSGLKGFTIGGAQISRKHAGFIVNKGDVTCADIHELIEHVQGEISKEHGVKLECEVLFVPDKNRG